MYMKNFKEIILEQNDEIKDEEGTIDLPTIDELVDDVYDDAELIDKMFELITDLDPDVLNDEQTALLYDILDIIAAYDRDLEESEDEEDDDMEDDEEEDDEEMKEALAARRKKIDRVARKQRAREYRRNKAKIKLRAKLYRKSAKGKRVARKAKRMSKLGKTSTGKRKQKFIK